MNVILYRSSFPPVMRTSNTRANLAILVGHRVFTRTSFATRVTLWFLVLLFSMQRVILWGRATNPRFTILPRGTSFNVIVRGPYFCRLVPISVRQRFTGGGATRLNRRSRLRLFNLFRDLFCTVCPFRIHSSDTYDRTRAELSISFDLRPSTPGIVSTILSPRTVTVQSALVWPHPATPPLPELCGPEPESHDTWAGDTRPRVSSYNTIVIDIAPLFDNSSMGDPQHVAPPIGLLVQVHRAIYFFTLSDAASIGHAQPTVPLSPYTTPHPGDSSALSRRSDGSTVTFAQTHATPLASRPNEATVPFSLVF